MHGMEISLAVQMAAHILAMNIAAPILILLLRRDGAGPGRRSGGGLAFATVVQIAALWAVHAPGMLHASHGSPTAALLVHAALFVIALWFWNAVLATDGDRCWRAVLALLITAKLFCLLGVLMVFAPAASVGALEDQHAAGLLMLVACPITYLLAAGLIVWRWLLRIEARPAQPHP